MTEANSQRTYARLAGLMYLVVIALDISGLLIVSQVTADGNFVTAAHSIMAAETLYRVGLGLLLAGSLGVIVLGAALYVTLRPVDGNLALTALLFRTVEAAVGVMGVITSFTVLRLELAATHTGAFSPDQLGALADLATNGVGMQVDAITFSLGSTLFFLVLLRSAYIPRILSAWGVFASMLYLAVELLSLILPQAAIVVTVATLPVLIAEIMTGGWLLIAGISVRSAPV